MQTSKNSCLKKFQISKNQNQKIKGGAVRKDFVDVHLCEIERRNDIKKGGNGSGDW